MAQSRASATARLLAIAFQLPPSAHHAGDSLGAGDVSVVPVILRRSRLSVIIFREELGGGSGW